MIAPLRMSAPDITEDDVQAVVAVLRSGRLALGSQAVAFERALAEYVGAAHAVAVSSGTAALHLIVRALGIGHGDEVLVPSFTFAASVNVLLYEGAVPVFVDIEPDTYNLDPADAAAKITPRTRAILVVDVFGHPAEWGELERLAKRHGLALIDDSCEALGSAYRGRRLGSLGDAAAFAFYPNKQITTGEGGMVVSGDERLVARARSLSNQGRGAMGAWLEHERLGYNYRLDELSAALGRSQLGRLESILERRDAVARRYTERLSSLDGVRPPLVRPHVRMSWFVYVVTLEAGLDRNSVMAAMERQGIPTRAYFTPVHDQPYIRERDEIARRPLPVTDAVGRRTMALPFHTNLSADDFERVACGLELAIAQSGRR